MRYLLCILLAVLVTACGSPPTGGGSSTACKNAELVHYVKTLNDYFKRGAFDVTPTVRISRTEIEDWKTKLEELKPSSDDDRVRAAIEDVVANLNHWLNEYDFYGMLYERAAANGVIQASQELSWTCGVSVE